MAEGEFSGELIANQDTVLFCTLGSRGPFGLLPHLECWRPHLPTGVDLVSLGLEPQPGEPPQRLHLRVRGHVTKTASAVRAGHRRAELYVSEILEAQPVEEIEPLW